MQSVKTTVFTKDVNFKMTPDYIADTFKDYEVDLDSRTVPEEAQVAIRVISEGEAVWAYSIDGKVSVVGRLENEDFISTFPIHYEYSEFVGYGPTEFCGHFNDVKARVYGGKEALNAVRARDRYDVVLLTEKVVFNPETDVLIVEEFGCDTYQLLFRDGKYWLDQTLTMVVRDFDLEPAMRYTINYAHSEDVAYARNMAKFFG